MTPNYIQEQLSLAYVKTVVYRSGFNFSRISVDDHGMDGTIQSYSNGVNRIDFQLKATTASALSDAFISYDLEVRTYNLLVEQEGIPAILIIYVMPQDPAQWLEQSEEQMHLRNAAFWVSFQEQPRSSNRTSQRVHVSRSNIFAVEGLSPMFTQLIPGWPKPRRR